MPMGLPLKKIPKFVQRQKIQGLHEIGRRFKERKQRGLPPPNPIDRYRDDPIGFITDGIGQFLGSSWWGWLVVIKAAFGEPLDYRELEFFRQVAGGRDPPGRRVKELWLLVGRRGGKDSAASVIATTIARFVDTSRLRLGEKAIVACLATDLKQAGIIRGYIRGYFENVPALQPWVDGKLSESENSAIPLVNHVEIHTTTNNYRAPRGFPYACIVFDECAFWSTVQDGSSPDVETFRAMEPGMGTLPDSMLIGITSTYRKRGLYFDRWVEFFGKNDPRVLVIQADTRTFNPEFDQEIIDKALKDDPEAAKAEYLSGFRDDLADYVDRKVVQAAVSTGVFERPPQRGIMYEGFIDPSGGSRDSFTLGIAHNAGGKGVLDVLLETRSPFIPSIVVKEYAAYLLRYGITNITGDRYAGVWPVEQFAEYGITYEQSAEPKSDIYRAFLPLLNSSLVDLLDNPRLVDQLCSLERRTARGGKDSIDHPNQPDAHDDVANAAAGVLLKVSTEVSSWELLARKSRADREARAAAAAAKRAA